MIGSKEVTPEFTVYQIKDAGETGPPVVWFILELNGVEDLGASRSCQEIHKLARRVCKDRGFNNAGLTEAFGRNRQFVQGPRGGFARFKP